MILCTKSVENMRCNQDTMLWMRHTSLHMAQPILRAPLSGGVADKWSVMKPLSCVARARQVTGPTADKGVHLYPFQMMLDEKTPTKVSALS